MNKFFEKLIKISPNNFGRFFIFLLLIGCFFVPLSTKAAYNNTVQSEPNLLYYWPMNDAAGTTSLAAAKGGVAITLTGATAGAAGQVDGTAVSFNGTSNSAQTASNLNLTAYNKVVVEALVYIPSYTTTGRTVWEFSPNVTNTPSDTFMFNVDGGVSGAEALSNVALQGDNGYSIATYSRPSSGSWHHVVTVYNKGLSSNEVDLYIDGVLQSATRPYNSNNLNNFGNRILYLMARNASTNFTQGKMQHLAIYSDLSADRILAHANLINTASAVTLSGPTTGLYSNSSTNFTVGANGNITITPNDGGVSGIFNPTSVIISSSTPTATFTYYPTTTGSRNISVTNDAGLANPSSVSYLVVAPATAVMLSGPTSGTSGVATSNYTVSTDNLASGILIVTPNDGGAGGTFSPTTITISSSTPTATFTYTPSSTGSKTISVANDGSLSNPSPISLVVSAAPAYPSLIQSESTLLNYWPMTESSGTSLSALAGGININLTGATVGAAGKVGGTAVSFNGTSNSGQTASAINLSTHNKVVVESLLYFNSYDGTYRAAWEFGAANFGFAYDGGTNGSPESNVFLRGNASYNLALYTRPNVAQWHHVVTVYNIGLSSNEVDLYVDGVLQSASSRPLNNNNTSNFGNSTLYLMSRSGNQYYGAGKMQHLAIYSDLSADRILAHANSINTASAVTLSGPTTGINESTSSNFSVSSDLPVVSSIIVTPNDGGAGGIFSPTTITISSSTPTATFTYTPSSSGSKTISVTNNGGLSNPSSVTYLVSPNTPATSVLFTGPNHGSVNSNSSNFTISADGIISGSLVITPNDGGSGGTFAPTTVTISSSTSTATFTYTPSSIGTKSLSIINNQGLINPANINYLVSRVGSGLVLGDSTVATYAGGTQIADFIYTSDQINAGWTSTNIAVPGHTIAQQKSTYLSTANRSTFDYTLAQIGLNDLNPAEASSVAIARLQDLVNTIDSNKKTGSLTIISTMIPCRQRLIDIYGATNGPLAYQKFLDINESIKGNGPTPITGVDYRISNHTSLLDDGNGNLNPIYDTGDHIHENNAARQIIARVWRDSLAEVNYLSADVPSTPSINSVTANNGSANIYFSKSSFTGGSPITSYTAHSNTGGFIGTGTSSPIIVSGLTTGSTYSFILTAENAIGSSTSSASSSLVTVSDTMAPSTISNFDSSWHSTSTNINLICDDGTGSGCAHTYYTTDGTTPTASSTEGTSFILSNEGIYTIKYFSADNNGNAESIKIASSTVKIDRSLPTTPGNPQTTTPTDSTNQIWTWASSTDAISGIANYIWRVTGAATTTGTTAVNSLTTSLNDGIYNLFVKAVDLAGNEGSESSAGNLIIDRSAPVISSILKTPLTETSVAISWATNEDSSSKVEFGLTSGYGNSTIESDLIPLVKNHSVNISGLATCSTYHFRVISKDILNYEALGLDNTFTTTGCTASSAVSENQTSQVDKTTGGTLTLKDSNLNGLTLNIPVAFATSSANFQAHKLDRDTVLNTISKPSGVVSAGDYIYELKALSSSASTISVFDNPLTISITYSANDISGVDESSLKIYRWDTGVWTQLSNCSVNPNTKTVTCETSHFSTFGLFGQETVNDTATSGSSLTINTPCSSVIYDSWQGTCMNGRQFRNIINQTPNFCSLTTEQRALTERACGGAASLETNQVSNIENVYKYERSALSKIIDKKLSARLAGRILLQVETKGQAWYLDTKSLTRYYLADGPSAYQALRQFGLGITSSDLNKIPVAPTSVLPSEYIKSTSYSNNLTNRLKGKILLQVENRGEAWYINPVDGLRYYLANGEAAYQIMRQLSLGITNENIWKISVGDFK